MTVSKLHKAVALCVLALWGLAAAHCSLEVLPGFGFLKSCCFVGSASSTQKDCDADGCGTVEKGNYRTEERTASAPQPLLVLALLSSATEARASELRIRSFVAFESPPEIPRAWQFSHRTALPPRAPSIAS